jgi:hypothetical protein
MLRSAEMRRTRILSYWTVVLAILEKLLSTPLVV